MAPDMSATARPWKIGSASITALPTITARAVSSIGRNRTITGSFFTATSMIGFIAGAGIVVRNSIPAPAMKPIMLVAVKNEPVMVRFRPMLLTALAVIVGSAVMLADPIFQGLAVALMSGAIAATLLSRYAVPILYHLLARHGRAAELQREGARALSAENEPQLCDPCAEPIEARTA